MIETWNYYHNNTGAIKSALASELKEGKLMLVLGAGASASVGLPSWIQLVNKCIEKHNAVNTAQQPIELVKYTDNLNDVLKRTSSVKVSYEEEEFINLVKESLYEDLAQEEAPLSKELVIERIEELYKTHNEKFLLEFIKEMSSRVYDSKNEYQNLLKNELLIAIGALLMGTKRGSIAEVITYNFDDVLEWYLNLNGFVVDIVTDPLALTKNADVTIYHPHGFLPFSDEFSPGESIVFDETSFNRRIGNTGDSPWRDRLRILLSTKKAIFIGLSGDDPTFGPSLERVQSEVKDRDIIGYWFRKSPSNRDQEISDKNNKILPIYVDDYSDIPGFLLEITQMASKAVFEGDMD